jgi:Flp pilus assembly protein TadD
MRGGMPVLVAGFLSMGLLAGCSGQDAQTSRAIESMARVDQENMSELMLTAADPREAVAYFTTASEAEPDRLLFQRGLARSLARAGNPERAVPVWQRIITHPDASHDDRVELAEAHIRLSEWDAAEAVLNQIPPTHETFQRYRLEAMVADARRQWTRADSFYEIAAGLTPRPAGVLNNWGYSKLSRGAPRDAERLFAEALQHDSTLFTAKNNLVLARAAQRRYELPVMPVTQTERAELLHTMALAAIRQGDASVGRALLRDAVDTHPQHFEAAAVALAALE